ncbi:hypothetical protein NP233_g4206 [Leucocoprinus birnbaumii]|uniref:O-methyltransferase C-terminal domain-containing protein n=1 Tax=Leucocoprinus birnbaumii TaxID=56174 RepID=A0AAD5VVU0_9AGAR|nr:hypothetical protein NP233_g4206 [Leucocoprinus birnbaumii]
MSDSPASDILQLLSIITNSTESLVSFYKSDITRPSLPSLDSTETHPLDSSVYPVEVKHSLSMLEGACAQLCASLARPSHTILNLGSDSYILLDKPNGMYINDISTECGIESKKLKRVLFSNDVFANNRLSMQLVSSAPMWSAGMHLVNEPNGKAVAHLADTLLDPVWGPSYAPVNTAFNRATGYPHPLYLYFDGKDTDDGAAQGARFGHAMAGWNEAADAGALVFEYPWGELPAGAVVNDLGGGVGYLTMKLYRHFPHLVFKLQDMPERIHQAQNEIWPQECPEAIANSKVQFKGVNLLVEAPLPNCDIYLLKNVIHNLPIDLALKVLLNIREVMSPHNKILINEFIVVNTCRAPGNEAEVPQAPPPLLPNFGVGRIRLNYLDIAMLTQFNSEERTLDDYVKLSASAGLRLLKVWDLGESILLELALT